MIRWFVTRHGKWHIAHPFRSSYFARSLCGREGPMATVPEPAGDRCSMCVRIALVWWPAEQVA